jgi:excinuclease ABC subunit C
VTGPAESEGRTDWRPETSRIPTRPGVYRFQDVERRVIYVGKARNLRSRLSSYFQDPSGLHPRTRAMVEAAAAVDWTVVGTEVEALALEYAWIKEFDPRFNVRYRDDKSYPYLAVTMGEDVPRAMVVRGARKKGIRYFGPYSHAWAIRDTLDQLLKAFPVRTCSSGVYRRARASGRPCLLADLDRCAAPCVDRISIADHRDLANELCRFLGSDARVLIADRRAAMTEAAHLQEYERAARLRDQIAALERVVERNAIALPPGTDADVLGIHQDELEAAAQVFVVRDGRVRGRRGWVTEKVEDLADDGLIEHLLLTHYSGAAGEDIPREILVRCPPASSEAVEAWLAERRGGPVRIKVPVRGDRATLLTTVERNAEQAFVEHRLRRSSDLTVRGQALEELQQALTLPQAPLRIECIDVSHLAGTGTVAAVVVFEDGAPRRSHYRSYLVRGSEGADDAAAIAEVIERRFRRLQSESLESADPSAPDGFAYRPQLLLVDGGPVQAAAAARVLRALGEEEVAVVGLAKRLEEVWPADALDPVVLPRGSQGLYLLQRVRDEAHRAAGQHQRKVRSRALTDSALDAVDGLGPARRRHLLERFGSVRGIAEAGVDDLMQVPGIGRSLARAIHDALGGPSAGPAAVNTATGEIMDR